jgi:mediator of RNA polymerase II transcription subunit 10
MVQVAAYDTTTRPSRDVLNQGLQALSKSFGRIHSLACPRMQGVQLPWIPPDLIQYVENGRNPDIYTREFVELVRRGNRLMRGKQAAFADFRDILARELMSALPEVAADVDSVVRATGGPGRRWDADEFLEIDPAEPAAGAAAAAGGNDTAGLSPQ